MQGETARTTAPFSFANDRKHYFSLRLFTDARFSTVLDSISMSKPRRSRYFSVSTWPVPSRDTPKPTYSRGESCLPMPSTLESRGSINYRRETD